MARSKKREELDTEGDTSVIPFYAGMNDAKEVVEKIRTDSRPLDEKILGRPYIMALSEGKLPLDSLTPFTDQQYHIITSDLRSIAGLLSRHR